MTINFLQLLLQFIVANVEFSILATVTFRRIFPFKLSTDRLRFRLNWKSQYSYRSSKAMWVRVLNSRSVKKTRTHALPLPRLRRFSCKGKIFERAYLNVAVTFDARESYAKFDSGVREALSSR